MIVYQTAADGTFIGTAVADDDPWNPGQYLLPDGCVTKKPPSKKGHYPKWSGENWELVKLPDPEPKPEPETLSPEDKFSIIRQQASFHVSIADCTISDAARAGAEIPKEWHDYRAALAEIAERETGDPASVIWPEHPRPISVPKKPETLQELASARRYEVETSGLILRGVTIDTSRASQERISSAFALSQATGLSVDFKSADGFISLSPDDMKSIAVAVGMYVQACFTAERKICEAIGAGEVTHKEHIDNWSWPSRNLP